MTGNHSLSHSEFAALAAGDPDTAVVERLLIGQFSKRIVMLTAILELSAERHLVPLGEMQPCRNRGLSALDDAAEVRAHHVGRRSGAVADDERWKDGRSRNCEEIAAGQTAQ